ncbi:WXG100 family type VII secretion target [Sanguibacter keddieii]|jgi:WXG100 family type VII secretion target|uniref:WXG100 family type VII secretion target n=1 Tax=Sanguibacter keddieii TaxID=60920 RepID=UPI0006615434|nr:WXG100 family type VII secretion target [Sanguibacter keddieii]
MDFQVNYGALDGAAADIKTGANNLQNCLDDLENTLNQLRSSWEGKTQEAYDTAQRQWNQGLEGLKDVLTRTSNAVDSARSNYQQTDQSNAARF